MNTRLPHPRVSGLRHLLAAAVALCATAVAAAQTTGSLEGRVQNTRSGAFVERARVTLEGTALETFTDADGFYRLANVPAGSARVRVFFTGLTPRTDNVTVAAGRVTRHDAGLEPLAGGTAVQLDRFVVGTTREMDGAAYAINEQRFAPNIRNVISADEFGGVAEGNAAEVLKFMPGVTVENSGGNMRFISINGVSPDNVPVTVDGFGLASSAGSTSRSVQVDMVSNNSLARLEVAYTPTPDSPASALAGSVNLVQRSSFERSRPAFNGSLYVMMRDNARDFRKTNSARQFPTPNVHPGFDFSYIAPLTPRFGFTVSGGHSTQYSPQDIVTLTWQGAGAPTNGTTFPHTTPDRPYLTSYSVLDAPKVTARNSAALTFDYRISAADRLSLGFQFSSFEVWFKNNTLAFNVSSVPAGAFTPTSTRGTGELQLTRDERHRVNRTLMPTLIWRHEGAVWKWVAGAAFSEATDRNDGSRAGFLRTSLARRSGVTISFADIFYLGPRAITVTDTTTGAALDPHQLGNYALASGSDSQNDSTDLQRSAHAHVTRDLGGRLPLSLKAGVDVRQAVRELRTTAPPFSYVGRDGRGSTTPVGSDDSALPFRDPFNSQRIPPYGQPRTDGVSNLLLLEHLRANPGQFVIDENAAYRAVVANSKYAREVVSSAFLRGDAALPDRRLRVVGGVRGELTEVDAQGPRSDPGLNLRRDAQGRPILGANGQPQAIATVPLEVSRLTYLERGTRARKEYLRLFPSVNASYNVREDVIARVAYYHSIGRPDFNQYAGGVTLPSTENPPSATNRITVNNAAIKAWTARSTTVRFEYYFGGVGLLTIGGFRRDFTNAFGGTVTRATPDFLALYGLDATTYGAYDVSTQVNVAGTVRMTGWDVSYRHALTFLPPWARGVQVFANGSAQRATGPNLGSFSGSNYIPRSASWGVSLTRPRYNLRANWNYRGLQRRGPVAAGASIEPNTYTWWNKRLYVDLQGDYLVHPRVAVFANLRNIGAAYEDTGIWGPNTPEHAQFRQRLDHGSLWTFGVKGNF